MNEQLRIWHDPIRHHIRVRRQHTLIRGWGGFRGVGMDFIFLCVFKSR
jgi:hypothetical protein